MIKSCYLAGLDGPARVIIYDSTKRPPGLLNRPGQTSQGPTTAAQCAEGPKKGRNQEGNPKGRPGNKQGGICLLYS